MRWFIVYLILFFITMIVMESFKFRNIKDLIITIFDYLYFRLIVLESCTLVFYIEI